jgi:hypothetical protein
LRGFPPTLGALGGFFFCHAYRIAQTYKNTRYFFIFLQLFP